MSFGRQCIRFFLGIFVCAVFLPWNPAGASPSTGESGAPTRIPVPATTAPSKISPLITALDTIAGISGTRVPIDVSPRWSGNSFPITAFTTRVMRNSEEWLDFWTSMHRQPPTALPRDTMAVAVVLGRRPTDGYAVRLADVIKQDGGNLIISYIESHVARNDKTEDKATVPWVIQLMPMIDGRVRFIQIPVYED